MNKIFAAKTYRDEMAFRNTYLQVSARLILAMEAAVAQGLHWAHTPVANVAPEELTKLLNELKTKGFETRFEWMETQPIRTRVLIVDWSE